MNDNEKELRKVVRKSTRTGDMIAEFLKQDEVHQKVRLATKEDFKEVTVFDDNLSFSEKKLNRSEQSFVKIKSNIRTLAHGQRHDLDNSNLPIGTTNLLKGKEQSSPLSKSYTAIKTGIDSTEMTKSTTQFTSNQFVKGNSSKPSGLTLNDTSNKAEGSRIPTVEQEVEVKNKSNIATRVQTANKVARGVSNLSELGEQNEDGGVNTVSNVARHSAKTVGRKATEKPKKTLIKKTTNAIAKGLKALIKKTAIVLAGNIEVVIPIAIVLVCVVALTSVFGGTGSKQTIANYEVLMTSYQAKYDDEVDTWKNSNPSGVVFGVRGDYGRIEWRAPLSIIQSISSKTELDQSEKQLLEDFDAAGLFERHIEGTMISKVKTDELDDNGKPIYEDKEVKTLSIVNPSLVDYKNYLESDYSSIERFSSGKGLTAGTTLSEQELMRIDALYGSDKFFYQFSDKFQDYNTSTGSNNTDINVESHFYQSSNPYTNSGLRGQCTWYVWGRTYEVTGKQISSSMGDAQNWINSAINLGYSVGNKPSKNSIMVLSGGTYGHVAYVDGWDGTNIKFSEGNFNNPNANNEFMVSYAREHYSELLNQDEVSYESLRSENGYQLHGMVIVGYIYLE